VVTSDSIIARPCDGLDAALGEQARSDCRTERLRARINMLGSLSRLLCRAGDLDDLFRAVYRELSGVLEIDAFVLGLYDEASQTVEVVRQVHSDMELPGGSFPVGSGLTSEVIRTGRARLIRHWSLDGPRWQVGYATEAEGFAQPESGMTVPVRSGERVVGVLSVQSYREQAYDEDDLSLLEAIAEQVAGALGNLRRSERLDSQLQRRVSEHEAILASMADALLIVDASGRIVRLNRAAREVLCIDDSGVLFGKPLSHVQWSEWPAAARAVAEALEPMIEALGRGEALREVEAEMNADGRRVLSFSCAPIHDEAGALVGGVIVFRDTTGKREMELIKNEVLWMASHDLRTPVTTIKGYTQLLERWITAGQATPEVMARFLGVVRGQSDYLVGLLNLLLDYSRLEAGRFALEPKRTNLVAVVNRVVASVQAMSDRYKVALHTPFWIEGDWDPVRLEQVLHNLLTNAAKYSPEHGLIEVTIEADEQYATVCVADQGVGLAQSELEQVFKRFYRAEGTRRLEGTGLGLYICQRIITAHGGRIWAESAGPGQGSKFCFAVPRFSRQIEATDVQ
jgi:two-component system, OmpR family, phosphate regulon sensor histidine kinase PhoR